MQAKWKGLGLVVLVVGLLASVPATAGPLGEGFYFSSGIIDIPKTNLLSFKNWKVTASGSYDRWGEKATFDMPGGTVNEDFSIGVGLTEWLQVGVMRMNLESYAGELQLRLLKETPNFPALCLGTLARFDKRDSIFYLVAGKHNLPFPLLGETNLFGGVGALIDSEVPPGTGQIRDKLRGLFVGIEKVYWPKKWKKPITFMLEYDGQDINLGFSYELIKRIKANFALTNVGGLFGERGVGIILAVEVFKI